MMNPILLNYLSCNNHNLALQIAHEFGLENIIDYMGIHKNQIDTYDY